jgi:hypothetical protein
VDLVLGSGSEVCFADGVKATNLSQRSAFGFRLARFPFWYQILGPIEHSRPLTKQ